MQPLVSLITHYLDVNDMIHFSRVSHGCRECVANSLYLQFTNFLNYGKRKDFYDSKPPSLQGRIFNKWIDINVLMMLEQQNHNPYYLLKKLKSIFDKLKIFYKTADETTQKEILKIDCPAFISEMVSEDDDQRRWEEKGMAVGLKVQSLLKELKILDLYEEEQNLDSINKELKDLKINVPIGFLIANCVNPWASKIFFVKWEPGKDNFEKREIVLLKDTKWENLKLLYRHFQSLDLKSEEKQEDVFYSLSDVRKFVKDRKKYRQIRSQVLKIKCFNKNMTREGASELEAGQFCLRYSSSLKDRYGNPFFVLTIKSLEDELFHVLMDCSNVVNIKQFESKMKQEISKYILKKSEHSFDGSSLTQMSPNK